MPAKGVTVTKDKIRQRQKEVLELRRYGLSYSQIATFMVQKHGTDLWEGYDERSAYYDTKKALAAEAKDMHETAKEVMTIELNRLDELLQSLYPRALGGDLKAVDRVLKIMRHRAALLGLEQPKRVQIHDWRSEIIDMLKTGVITIDQVRDTLSDEQYEEVRRLLIAGGEPIIEARFVEEESESE